MYQPCVFSPMKQKQFINSKMVTVDCNSCCVDFFLIPAFLAIIRMVFVPAVVVVVVAVAVAVAAVVALVAVAVAVAVAAVVAVVVVGSSATVIPTTVDIHEAARC